MAKWDAQTLITGASTSTDDLLLISDQSQAEGSQDRNITLGELSVGTGRFVVGETGHGLSVGDCVWFDGTNYVEATADTSSNARLIGVIVEVPDVNTLVFQQAGFAFGLSGLVAGSTYYLQDAGGLGTSAGSVVVPVLVAVSSTAGWVILGPQEGAVYEEGTWTPLVTDGTNNATMTTQEGVYTLIGNTVFVSGSAVVNLIGSVGTARISGLPFAVGQAPAATFSFGRGTSLNGTAGYNLVGVASTGDAYLTIQRWDTATGTTAATGTELSNGADMRFSGFYQI